MRDSLPSARYSPICNVLRQWKTSLTLFIESTDSMIRMSKFRFAHAQLYAYCLGAISGRYRYSTFFFFFFFFLIIQNE